MHPFVAEQLSRSKLDELRREADLARLARSASASEKRVRRVANGRIRIALGGGLVRLGLRLAGTQQADW